jgi:hypothetical protein
LPGLLRSDRKDREVVYSDESGVGSIEKEPVIVAAIMVNMDSQRRGIDDELFGIICTTPRKIARKKLGLCQLIATLE